MKKSSIISPLWGRAFRRVFVGEGLAVLADTMFFIALTLLVLDIAGPGLQLGSVLAVASIPGAALMLVGGWVSERVSPVLVLVFSNTGRALLTGVFAALILTDSILLWHVYALAGFLSALNLESVFLVAGGTILLAVLVGAASRELRRF